MAFATSLSPATRVFLTCTFFFSSFLLYGRTHFYRDPGGIFFDQSRAFERHYSALRLAEVEKTYNAIQEKGLDGSGLPSVSRIDRVDVQLCVSMTTSRRNDLPKQYVEDAVVSMLDGLTATERRQVHLSLLFTDFDASSHPSWHKGWLRSALDDVWTYDSDNGNLTPETRLWLENATHDMEVANHLKSKATMDYALGLQRCLESTNAPYVAVFEGDILMTPGWVAPTLQALSSATRLVEHKAKSWVHQTRSAHDWLDMRLFNQERSTGWSSRRLGANNELSITLGIDILLISSFFRLRKRSARTQKYLDHTALIVICMYTVPVSVVLFFQAGKASLLPPSPGVAIENFGCCSQALIFNRKHVPSLIEYLQDHARKEFEGTENHLGYDMRTRDYASSVGLDRLALYPVQVQHMGIKSAVGTTKEEAQSIWSMAYEDLEPAKLKARHDKAMDELFDTIWREDEASGE